MNDWMLKLARRRKIRTSAPFHELTDEERIWLLDGEEGPRAKWDEDKWRACTASSNGSNDAATRLTCESCSRSIGASSPVPRAAAPS